MVRKSIKKMRKHLLYFLLVLISNVIVAQSSGVTGLVLGMEQGEPLIGATVKIGDKGTTTESDGRFKFLISPGSYILEVSYIGYVSQSIEVTVGQNLMNQDINLELSSEILETATVTGSRHEKSIARSPVSINVIKPELIENTNTVRIVGLLDKIPGVQINDNQANIRGGSGWSYGAGSRVLLLIDDIPALQVDAGRPSWGDIPVENISQIEVLKGASSTLYGSAALNGIINIRTGYATSEPVTKANVSYTNYFPAADQRKQWWDNDLLGLPNRYSAGIVHKQKFGKLDVVANGFYENLKSYNKDAFEKKTRLSANLKYRVNDKINIGLNTMTNFGTAGDFFLWNNAITGAYQGLDGSFSERDYNRFYVDPFVSIYDKKGNRHKILGRYFFIDNNNSNNQSNSSKTIYGEYQYLRKLESIGLDLTGGIVMHNTRSDSELFGDVVLKANNYASYLEADKKFNEKLTATFGIRYEVNEHRTPEVVRNDTIPGGRLSEGKFILRTGLNYKIAKGTFMRASWGQGYRYPTITERFIETAVGGFFIFPNVDLTSETGWTSEWGIKQGVRIGSWEGFVDLALFWSQYNNMTEFTFIQQDVKVGFQSQNIGDVDIKGFEVNFIGRSKIGKHPINILSGYTYIIPRYRDFENNTAVLESISTVDGELENFLKYRNLHNFKIDIEGTFNKFMVGMSVNYTSHMKTIDNLLGVFGQIALYRDANKDGFLKWDARMAYNFKHFKISIVGENLLNTEYTLRPGLLEAPRNASIRLDFNLQ